MKTHFKNSLLFPAVALLAVAAGPAKAAESTLQFNDPSQPGHLVVKLGFGDVEIVGAETSAVTVHSEVPAAGTETPREDGLRRLDSDNGFLVNESDNVITLSFGWPMMGGKRGSKNSASDVVITVPRNTAVTIERGGTGDVGVCNLTGDVEIRGAIGDVELENMAGGVLLEATNGDIDASFAELPEAKPVSITVVNGDVNVSVPSDARANVRLRTLHGEMLTDFSEAELETRFENTNDIVRDTMKPGGGKAALEIARADLDQQRAVLNMQRERDHQQRLAQALGAGAAGAAPGNEDTIVVPSPQPMPRVGTIQIPMPPLPKLPPMAGGKLVVGNLNGGGTEVLITTLTGTITLRKQDRGETGE